MHAIQKPARRRFPFLSVGALALALLHAAAPRCAARPAPDDGAVGPAEQAAVVARLIEVLETRYVFPEIARALGDTLRGRARAGAFARAVEPEAFVQQLNHVLRTVSRDGHLWVMVSDAPLPVRGAPTPAEQEERRRRLARSNFGFRAVQILPGNVGYLDLGQFVAPELAGDAAAAAVHFLASSDALIVDLRRNAGGSSDMVVLLASYFLGAEPVHLFDRYLRPEDRTEQHWTQRWLPGSRLDRQPLYLLTHERTFSAPEALAYLLQQLERATVVGARTAGGANPGAFHRIGDRFVAFVAEGAITVPATGGNWEGTGVVPQVEVAAEEALAVAHRMALQELLRHEEDGEWRLRLRQVLEELAP
jgi:retinol-binding protein 3